MMNYPSRVECPSKVRLDLYVLFTIKGMRIVKHPRLLLLIGTDILTGGHPPDLWNLIYIEANTNHETRVVKGALMFEATGLIERCPMVHTPSV